MLVKGMLPNRRVTQPQRKIDGPFWFSKDIRILDKKNANYPIIASSRVGTAGTAHHHQIEYDGHRQHRPPSHA